MGEVVNLRRIRNRQAKAVADVEAAANRIAHGVSKKMKNRAVAERVLAKARLEGHRRLGPGDAD
jgi:hypothetical protein